jgi:hypothetical protein
VICRHSSNGLSLYAKDTHLSIFKPATAHGMYSEWGFHLKRRGADRTWRHYVLRLFEKATPVPGGRGCWKCELVSYRTRKAKGNGSSGNRLTIKRFVRLKVGYGGTKPTSQANSQDLLRSSGGEG